MNNKNISIVFTGDIGFDKYMNNRWLDENLLSSDIYSFLQNSNHVVANLEGAVYQPEDSENKSSYFHTIDPQAISIIKKMNADIWSIGNNHIMDAGTRGLISTQKIAKQENCLTVGAGINEDEASKPICLDNNAIGIICVGYENECIPATLNTAGCFNWNNFELIKKRILEIKSKCRWCVVVSHAGEEFSPIPMPYTRERYIKFLKMGADVVVGHHPHVPENYEIFDNGKMIFYSLGNFIFDTDYQRAHLHTDIGILLKLNFTNENITFEAIGVKLNREQEKIEIASLPDIFTNIPEKEYALLSPLGAKAFIAEDKRKMIYLEPNKYSNCSTETWDNYFLKNTHEDYVKGSHMDFEIILPLAEKANYNNWKESKLSKVKSYILNLL